MKTVQIKKCNVQFVAIGGPGLTNGKAPAMMLAEQGRSLGKRTPFLYTFLKI